MYIVYTEHIYSTVSCVQYWYSHTLYIVYDYEVFSPFTPRKYNVLNGNFVFSLRDVFQKCIHSVK